MPFVGSTAYNLLGTVLDLVRAQLNDRAGNVYTDSVLLPFANSSYRRVQRKLANSGVDLFITDDALLVVPLVNPVDASQQVTINDATPAPNQLPPNLLVPAKLWERPNLSSQDFVEMIDLTEHGGLPSRVQGATLGVWEWRTDGLYFIGATQDTQIRLRFTAALDDLVDATSPILIRNAQEAIAYGTTAQAGLSRENPLASNWDTAAEDADEDVIAFYFRRQQHSGSRRRPYGSRCRGWAGRG